MIARFLISTTNATTPREEGDVLYLPSGGSLLRNISPLISLVSWLQYATTHAPFNTARFLLKVDDDAFIHLPEVASWMRLLDRSHDQDASIYFGRCFWTAYDGPNFLTLFSTHKPDTPAYRRWANACDGTNHTCAGPFPYATGSLPSLASSPPTSSLHQKSPRTLTTRRSTLQNTIHARRRLTRTRG